MLQALGLPAGTDADVAASLASLQDPAQLPPLLTAELGATLHLPHTSGRYRIHLEHGGATEGTLPDVTVPDTPGYHRLEADGWQTTLAVAPRQGWTVRTERPWGLAVQLYALRRTGDGGIGDFGGLAEFVEAAGRHGASCVAISPVHAQFAATVDRFSPYSPSSRTMLNVLHAKIDVTGRAAARLEAQDLIDWPEASRLRLAQLAERVRGGRTRSAVVRVPGLPPAGG